MATSRPRISQEFIRRHQRERLVTALSNCVIAKGYHATIVSEVVAGAGVARNTFYDNFSSKASCGRCLLHAVAPVIDSDKLGDSAFAFAVEIAALIRVGSPDARSRRDEAEEALELPVRLEPLEAEPDSPLSSMLPPGRHGLPRDFVSDNQLTRLLAGTAQAVHEHGYANSTIAQIVEKAAVSRRTFYEHFASRKEAVEILLARAEEQGAPRNGVSLTSGLGALWAEIIAAALCDDQVHAEILRFAGQSVLRMLPVQLDAPAVAA
jgi:AcrR family transcriptional regulator